MRWVLLKFIAIPPRTTVRLLWKTVCDSATKLNLVPGLGSWEFIEEA